MVQKILLEMFSLMILTGHRAPAVRVSHHNLSSHLQPHQISYKPFPLHSQPGPQGVEFSPEMLRKCRYWTASGGAQKEMWVISLGSVAKLPAVIAGSLFFHQQDVENHERSAKWGVREGVAPRFNSAWYGVKFVVFFCSINVRTCLAGFK